MKEHTVDGDVGRLSHVVATIKPPKQVAAFGNDENSRADTIDSYNFASRSNSQTGYNVDVANGNLLEEVAISSEDLHAGAFIATVTNYVFACGAHHRHLAGVPELTFVLPGNPELELVSASLLKHLII